MLDDITSSALLREEILSGNDTIASLTVRHTDKGNFLDIVPSAGASQGTVQKLIQAVRASATVTDVRTENRLVSMPDGEKAYECTKIVCDGDPAKVLGELMLGGIITSEEMQDIYKSMKLHTVGQFGRDQTNDLTSRILDGLADRANATPTPAG